MLKFYPYWPVVAAQNSQDPNAPQGAVNTAPAPQAPYIAPPLPGYPTQQSTPKTKGVTVVNSTSDPRVIWEDGKIAIIFARDFPANTGMGRSATRKDLKDAIMAQIDPGRTTMPGANSMNDFVKVVLGDLLARPLGGKAPSVKPKMFSGRPDPVPMIASGYGSVPKGTIIPDAHFPHKCGVCGDWYYQGTGEHPTPDGACPRGNKSGKR